MRAFRRLVWVLSTLVLVTLAGCGSREPLEPGANDDKGVARPGKIFVPLEVTDYRVTTVDRQRAVFFKFSRIPEGVDHRAESNPARIVLEVKGPTGAESSTDSFPGEDSLIPTVRLTRSGGVLVVALELQADDPPLYSVSPMADWLMVLISPP